MNTIYSDDIKLSLFHVDLNQIALFYKRNRTAVYCLWAAMTTDLTQRQATGVPLAEF